MVNILSPAVGQIPFSRPPGSGTYSGEGQNPNNQEVSSVARDPYSSMSGLNGPFNTHSDADGSDKLLPGVDQRIYGIQGQQQGLLDKAMAMPDEKPDAYRESLENQRRGLRDDIAGVRKATNSRGLLYSGVRAQGEADAAAGRADQYANESAKIAESHDREDLIDEISTQNEKAIFGIRDLEQSRYDVLHNELARREKAQSDFYSSVADLGGNLGGKVVGGLL